MRHQSTTLSTVPNFCYQSNFLYYDKYSNKLCSQDYITEYNRRIYEIIIYVNKCYKNSHILKQPPQKGHSNILDKNLKELRDNYRSSFLWKVSKALFIRPMKPLLNIKEKSIKLHL